MHFYYIMCKLSLCSITSLPTNNSLYVKSAYLKYCHLNQYEKDSLFLALSWFTYTVHYQIVPQVSLEARHLPQSLDVHTSLWPAPCTHAALPQQLLGNLIQYAGCVLCVKGGRLRERQRWRGGDRERNLEKELGFGWASWGQITLALSRSQSSATYEHSCTDTHTHTHTPTRSSSLPHGILSASW